MCFNEWDLRVREQQASEVTKLHEVMEHHRLEVLDRQAREHLHDEHVLARRRVLQSAQRLSSILREAVREAMVLWLARPVSPGTPGEVSPDAGEGQSPPRGSSP